MSAKAPQTRNPKKKSENLKVFEVFRAVRVVGRPSYATRMEYYRPEHVASSGTSSDKFYSCFGGISGPGGVFRAQKPSTGRTKERIFQT